MTPDPMDYLEAYAVNRFREADAQRSGHHDEAELFGERVAWLERVIGGAVGKAGGLDG